MDTPAKVAFGGGLVTALAVGGLVTAGLLATSAVVVSSDPTAPPTAPPAAVPAAGTGLVRFADCTALRAWYADHALQQVGPWGWDGGVAPMMVAGKAAAREPSASAPTEGVANGPTGTNTQEVGVDEPDVAKTDGRIVVRLRDGHQLVVTDVSGTSPHELADWRLPAGVYADAFLLVDHHVVLTGSDVTGREGLLPGGQGASTDVYDVDLSDPTRPRLDGHATSPGRQLSMRQYADTVRLVTTAGLPPLRFVQPQPGTRSRHEAEQHNRAIVRSSRTADWIPGLKCDQVYRPQIWSGPETVTVTTFHPGSVEATSKVAVSGAGSEVYSSADRLYVTSTEWTRHPVPWRGPGVGIPARPPDTRTHVHVFALDGARTRYLASGVVDGVIRDRWSMDEHDGRLRVAVSWPSLRGGQDNGVVVLEVQDGRLVQVGELHGLGTGEDIQSVRWFDNLAVVVTFRQMDPLYTIDLSDPHQPRRLGALKVPGFSAYLHPIGAGQVLGLGSDATAQGQDLGAQAAVFDLRDTAHAHVVGKVTFGHDSRFEAGEDPHAFTWLPGDQAAIATLDRGSGSVPVLLRVAPDGSLSTSDLPSVGGWGARALPLADGRVALVGDRVRIVDIG